MTADKKRFLISITAALAIHIGVLVLTGLQSFNYEPPPESGPLIVELSLPEPERPQPMPEEELPADEAVEDSAAESAPTPTPLPEPAPTPAPTPVPSQRSIPSRPAAEKPPEDDYDLLANIRQRRTDEDLNAEDAFGDDPLLPTTTDSTSVSGQSRGGSRVVEGQTIAPVEEETSPVEVEPEEPDTGFLGEEDFKVLEANIANATDTAAAAESPGTAPGVISIVGVPEGHSGIVDFQGGGESRKLEKMVVPDMPEDIKSAGNPEYRVVISFRVDSEGLATGFTYKGHSLNSEVDAAVLEALRRWTFSRAPAGQNGKMLEATLTYVIEIK